MIDIFSISLKSMDEVFYKKITKAELQPVLNAIKIVAKHDVHLEISQLVVTGLNDNDNSSRDTAKWIIDNLGADIPLHYVRFHPNYKYMHVERTDPAVLYRAKEIAISESIKYVYIGNLYEEGVGDTYCPSCNNILVKRFGMDIKVEGLDENNQCSQCGYKSPIKLNNKKDDNVHLESLENKYRKRNIYFKWINDINALHLQSNDSCKELSMVVTHVPSGFKQALLIGKNHGLNRIMISKSNLTDTHVDIEYFAKNDDTLHELGLLDRAHFPVENSSKGNAYRQKCN